MHTLPDGVQTVIDSPLGPLRLMASAAGLAGVWFIQNQRHAPAAERVSAWTVADTGHPVLQEAAQQLHAYFRGQRPHFELPVDLAQGTPFQREVWRALQAIPFGQTCSYGALAQAIGRPSAVRAVGAAVGRNPLSIVVPCHRVVGRDGGLTGYAGGIDRKRALLRLEAD